MLVGKPGATVRYYVPCNAIDAPTARQGAIPGAAKPGMVLQMGFRCATVSSHPKDATGPRIVAEGLAERLRGFLAGRIRGCDAINEDVEGWVLDVGYGTQVTVGWEEAGDKYSVGVSTWDSQRNLVTPLPLPQFHDRLVDLIDQFLASDSRISTVRWSE